MILGCTCGSMHGRGLFLGSWSLPLVPWLLVLGPWLLASGVLCSLCMNLAWPSLLVLGPRLSPGAVGPWLVAFDSYSRISQPTWLWHHHGRTHACVLSFAATACYQPLTCAWVHCSRLFSPLQRHTLMIYIISPRPKPRGPSPKPTLSLQASRAYRFQQSTSTLGSRAWHEARLWRQHDLIIEVLSMKFLWYQVSALGAWAALRR